MSGAARRVVCVGEGMVELASRQGGWHVHYGGDTLNVALHLARLGHDTAYLTALGCDPFAGSMRREWACEGLDLALVLSHATRTTGLYAIETDAEGERRFFYWRGQSAARALFECDGIAGAEAAAREADLLFFSLISLAILPEDGRERLLSLAGAVRSAGGKVAFDSNYRAGLWDSQAAARDWRDRAIAVADIGLPTREDEIALGAGDAPAAIAEYWHERGAGEVLVKLGAHGCLLPDGDLVPPPDRLVPLDTSGAGDAFDAGYLAARLRGEAPAQAALRGQRLAAWTLMRQGAIPPRDPAAPHDETAAGVPE